MLWKEKKWYWVIVFFDCNSMEQELTSKIFKPLKKSSIPYRSNYKRMADQKKFRYSTKINAKNFWLKKHKVYISYEEKKIRL